MNGIRMVAAAALLIGLAFAAGAAEKADVSKDKLVGTWEATKGDMPKGSTLTFGKDGALKVVVANEKKETYTGTFTVEGDTVKSVLKFEGKEEKFTHTIVKLTDTDLVTRDEKGGTDEFKKVKAK